MSGVTLEPATTILHQRAKGVGRLVAKPLDGRTRIAEFYQEGCAKIRLPDTFTPHMEAVLINTSGGLTGGDRISWQIDAGQNTHVTVTTQACEKVYKSSGGVAEVDTRLNVEAGATLHWLPQETILFDNAWIARRLDVDLATDATFVGLEAVLLGRRAMGEAVETGLFRDRWRVRRNGKLIHAEEARLGPDVAHIGRGAASLGGAVAFATLLYCGADCDVLLPKIRAVTEGRTAGASHWQNKLIVRFVAPDGMALRKMLIPVISLLRNGQTMPKVWNL
jgi:urease accessory protein